MSVLRKSFLSALRAAPVLAAMCLFLLAPARYAECVRQGVSLWAASVLPATFPFLFLTALLTQNSLFDKFSRLLAPAFGRTFRVSGAGGCAAVLAAVSGYPVGARTVADLAAQGRVSREEVFRLSCLATSSGPMFLVGVAGAAMANSPAAGWLLLLAHFFGIWSVSFLLRFGKKTPSAPPVPPAALRGDRDALWNAVVSVLCVGGAIALFSAFGQMLADLLPADTPRFIVACVRGLAEMTTGCAMLAGQKTPLALAACAFFVTFGGACVLVQQLGFLTRAGVKPIPFLLVKFAQGGVAAAAMYALALLL